jgi:hypothetical protein
VTFDPRAHLIQLPKRVKDPQTGHVVTRHDGYLEVKWRLVWFREKYPHGVITTAELCVDLDRGYARYRATVEDGDGGKTTGHGTETKADFTDYCERAETRAIGRALAALGIGTQFVGEEFSEGEHVADAPVSHTGGKPVASAETFTHGGARTTSTESKKDQTANLQFDSTGKVVAPTNGHDPHPERPTEAHIGALRTLALQECGTDEEEFQTRIRRTMGLKPGASVAPKLLSRAMSMSQYMTVFEYYACLSEQLARPTPEASAH